MILNTSVEEKGAFYGHWKDRPSKALVDAITRVIVQPKNAAERLKCTETFKHVKRWFGFWWEPRGHRNKVNA